MAVGVASVWCVVAAVSVAAGESLASGAAFLFAESSGVDSDGLGCNWKRFGMICDAARDDARVETASRM